MRKFRDIVEDIKAPNTNDIWFNNGELKYYGPKGWTSLVQNKKDDSTEESINQIKESLDYLNEKVDSLPSIELSDKASDLLNNDTLLSILQHRLHDLHIPLYPISANGSTGSNDRYFDMLQNCLESNRQVTYEGSAEDYNLYISPLKVAICSITTTNSTYIGFIYNEPFNNAGLQCIGFDAHNFRIAVFNINGDSVTLKMGYNFRTQEIFTK